MREGFRWACAQQIELVWVVSSEGECHGISELMPSQSEE